jgi:Amt family ammonium transporter
VVIGYSLSFGPAMISLAVWGKVMLNGITPDTLFQYVATSANAIPEYVFVMFQMMFAIITIGLVSGAIAERMKFSAWCLFALSGLPWSTIR